MGKTGVIMTGKRWVTLFVTGVIFVVLFIAGMNYFVDPFNYFKALKGDYFVYDDFETDYSRHIKAEYIKKHGQEYDAYIIGGSKSGAISTEKLSEVDGYKYYNSYVLSGNFNDYVNYTKYVIENCKPQKILLHISGLEVAKFNREERGDVYAIPAAVKGESTFLEKIEFLMKNIEVSVNKINNRNTKFRYPVTEAGERDLEGYEQLRAKDPEAYAKKYVTYNYKSALKTFFEQKRVLSAVDENLAALKTIKKICDKNNVELMIIIGPAFTSERYEFETEEYYKYLGDIIDIAGEIWDFSGDCAINRNPNNFYNRKHYTRATANRMVEVIKENIGNETFLAEDGFGQHVTQKNRTEFLERRRALFAEMKQEYEKTGTIAQESYDAESRIEP